MNIFWFRRDLRLDDNAALHAALSAGEVLPVFIFDINILGRIKDKNDRRVSFIYERIRLLKSDIEKAGSTLLVLHGKPVDVFKQLLEKFSVDTVYAGRDYEPYAVSRDREVGSLLKKHDASLCLVKDHVLFESDEILKADGTPYVVYTPYMRNWKKHYLSSAGGSFPSQDLKRAFKKRGPARMPSLKGMGFQPVEHGVPEPRLEPALLREYDRYRDFPHRDATSRLGPHLRFGTVSVRRIAAMAMDINPVWFKQLIWREFFIQVLAHFPYTERRSFRRQYDAIPWRNNRTEFRKWCEGRTGFPMVDAGMRQLNDTGYMHNRVRMITANFLTKLLLVDWRWGESYFAGKLLDYEMANNVGGWQWACGSGCDAAPYFRIFNPDTQIQKFDPEFKYIRKWLPEFDTADYPGPIIDYSMARTRALSVFKATLAEEKARSAD